MVATLRILLLLNRTLLLSMLPYFNLGSFTLGQLAGHRNNVPGCGGIAEDGVQGLQVAVHCLGVEEVDDGEDESVASELGLALTFVQVTRNTYMTAKMM